MLDFDPFALDHCAMRLRLLGRELYENLIWVERAYEQAARNYHRRTYWNAEQRDIVLRFQEIARRREEVAALTGIERARAVDHARKAANLVIVPKTQIPRKELPR